MIFDHADIYITVMPGESKIMTVQKPDAQSTDIVYDAQNRLFQFLEKAGVVDPTTVEGGDLYGTIEGTYYESESNPSATQVAVFMIGKFIEDERPYFIFRQAQEELEMDRISDPDDEYSTELGEVPHGVSKGSIDARGNAAGISNYTYYQEHIEREVKQLFHETKQKGKK